MQGEAERERERDREREGCQTTCVATLAHVQYLGKGADYGEQLRSTTAVLHK